MSEIANSFKHGHSAASVNGPKRISTEYKCWATMIQRCCNPNSPSYADYGGRGITICDEWRHSFEQFIIDMGLKPHPSLSIDRKDNSLGYFKENCRWATRSQQVLNQRQRRLVNQKVRSDSRTGVKNVIWSSDRQKYRAYLRKDHQRIHLGYYSSIEDAQRAIAAVSLCD